MQTNTTEASLVCQAKKKLHVEESRSGVQYRQTSHIEPHTAGSDKGKGMVPKYANCARTTVFCLPVSHL
jgi:hypothetical protein